MRKEIKFFFRSYNSIFLASIGKSQITAVKFLLRKTFFELKERSDLIKLFNNFVVNIFRRQFFNSPEYSLRHIRFFFAKCARSARNLRMFEWGFRLDSPQ